MSVCNDQMSNMLSSTPNEVVPYHAHILEASLLPWKPTKRNLKPAWDIIIQAHNDVYYGIHSIAVRCMKLKRKVVRITKH